MFLENDLELAPIIRNNNINKASNIPHISTKLFKDCCLCILPQLIYLFNLIFITSDIPVEWKIAKHSNETQPPIYVFLCLCTEAYYLKMIFQGNFVQIV